MPDQPNHEPERRPTRRFDPLRLLGGTLLSSLLGLIVYAGLSRASQPGDAFYLLVRWPVWLLAFVAAPLLAFRLALWRSARKQPAPTSPRPESD